MEKKKAAPKNGLPIRRGTEFLLLLFQKEAVVAFPFQHPHQRLYNKSTHHQTAY
jgi:hypothetical protein